jgi:hypothetical protein
MPWTRKLPAPIILKDGRALVRLIDARDLILGLTERRQADAHRQPAAEALMKAASHATQIDVAGVANQLTIALRAEGLI